MKFLTLDWWMGITDDSSVLDKYEEDFEAIKGRLPKSVVEFKEAVSLHDGRIFNIEWQPEEIKLHISCYVYDEKGVGIGRDFFEVTYGEVKVAQLISDPEKGLLGPFGFGDMGYDEWEIKEGGNFCHSILCSSGIEIKITFKTMAWKTNGKRQLFAE